MRGLGIRLVNVHIATFAESHDTVSNLAFLQKRGYRMTTLFELLCFIDSNSDIVGHNDVLVTIEDHARDDGSKPCIETYAHCVRRSPKGSLVYKLYDLRKLLQEQRNENPPLLHFIVMDAESPDVEADCAPEPPSGI
jgi:hypothetical protein